MNEVLRPSRSRRQALALCALGLPLAALPLLTAAAAAGTTPAEAPRFSAAEIRALRSTVQAQLTALAAGDAARAYGYASDAIQRQFGDADRFMAMVLTAYPMLVRPASVAFLLPERAAGNVVQSVQLRDRAGKAWLAAYGMEAQSDSGWRIAGCVVVADSQRLST